MTPQEKFLQSLHDLWERFVWWYEDLVRDFGYLWPIVFILCLSLFLVAFCWMSMARAEEINLKASWYSVESLKKEGTFKYSKGVMANGKLFRNDGATAACNLFPLGTTLRITSTSGRSVIVKVTDRINKRFTKTRIDLSKGAFAQIADLKQGLIPVIVEVVK